MIKLILKHKLIEVCINTVMDKIISNFPPKLNIDDIHPGDMMRYITFLPGVSDPEYIGTTLKVTNLKIIDKHDADIYITPCEDSVYTLCKGNHSASTHKFPNSSSVYVHNIDEILEYNKY